MDLSGVPTEDLQALKSGDLSKVSTATLQKLKGGGEPPLTEAQQRVKTIQSESTSPLVRAMPDFVKGAGAGFTGEKYEGPTQMREPDSMAQRLGHLAGQEGPAIAGGLAMGAASGGMSAVPAIGMAAVGGAAGEAYRQIFGQNPLLGEKGLTQEEAVKLMSVKALEQGLGEAGGRLTKGAIDMIKGASIDQLRRVTGLSKHYVDRAWDRPAFALPKIGETVAQTERAAMGHLDNIQGAILKTREATGRAVNAALENLHAKFGGAKVVDTSPIAESVRNAIGDIDKNADPTLEVLNRADREKIAEILSTMETRDDVPASRAASRGNMPPSSIQNPPSRMSPAGGTIPRTAVPMQPQPVIDPLTGGITFPPPEPPAPVDANRLHAPSLSNGPATPSNFTNTGRDPLTGGALPPKAQNPNMIHGPSYSSGGGISNMNVRDSMGNLNPGMTSTRPMKSIRDLVGIRRAVDELVDYTDQGLPKGMQTGAGQRFIKALADNIRSHISEIAGQSGKEGRALMMANAEHSSAVTNYDQWNKFLNTATEGSRDSLRRIQSIGSEVAKGGQSAGQLENLKQAFPRAARSIDALHDSLARRAILQAEDKPSSGWVSALLRQAAGSRATPAEALRAARLGAGSSLPNAVRGTSALTSGVMNQAVINALLAHIKPEEKKK